MNILKCFCRTAIVEQTTVPPPSNDTPVEKPIETVAPIETKDITETDPIPVPTVTDDTSTMIEDGGVVIKQETVVDVPKLKPASKYTIGKKLSMAYLTPNRYFFIKSRYSEDIVLFGKCIEFDKNKVIFRLSDTNELNVFDYKLFNFYRAIPKK